jgi:formylmethanofuran dehydrogenase subunit E
MVTQSIDVTVSRTKHGVPIVSFVGCSGSGKTTLLERVVRELKRLGYRVATVKHTPHGFDVDHPGKDSWRFSQAGSDIVVLSSHDKLCVLEEVRTEVTLTGIETLIGDKADIVLVEGYKNSAYAKVLVRDDRQEPPQVAEAEHLATMSLQRHLSGVTQYDDSDIAKVITLLTDEIERLLPLQINSALQADNGIDDFEGLLAESAVAHGHVCPGQVLGVRMAICGCRELGIQKPRTEDKHLIVYVEIDRCAIDAIQVVTGCKLAKRTMKHLDYGKLAATFVDLHGGGAVRVAAREDARQRASLYGRQGWTKEEVQIAAYKEMRDEELFNIAPVLVSIPDEDMPGPPLRRVICAECGEGVNDRRELAVSGKTLCRSCAYGSYWKHPGKAD